MADIYIAGQYSRRDEFRAVAKSLVSLGHRVTSRWLDEVEPLDSQMGDHSGDFYSQTSLADLEDIDRSNCVLFFSEDPKVGIPRGCRHVEFGYAMANEMFIAVVGPKENIFHYVQPIAHFSTVEEFLDYAAY